jgi:hypothetical protein
MRQFRLAALGAVLLLLSGCWGASSTFFEAIPAKGIIAPGIYDLMVPPKEPDGDFEKAGTFKITLTNQGTVFAKDVNGKDSLQVVFSKIGKQKDLYLVRVISATSYRYPPTFGVFFTAVKNREGLFINVPVCKETRALAASMNAVVRGKGNKMTCYFAGASNIQNAMGVFVRQHERNLEEWMLLQPTTPAISVPPPPAVPLTPAKPSSAPESSAPQP